MIYNPSKTALILEAEERGIPYISGLCMLVAQAKAASEFFTGNKIEDAKIDEITAHISFDTKNIMLIGMPGVGKTTNGRLIAQKLRRDFVDIDSEIVKRSGKSIPDIFAEQGEGGFRDIEHSVLEEFSRRSGLVISCGGGTVTRSDNIKLMKQNSTGGFHEARHCISSEGRQTLVSGKRPRRTVQKASSNVPHRGGYCL